VISGLQTSPDAIIKADPKAEQYRERIVQCANILRDIYHRSAVHVDNLGLKDWPQQVIHTDWHAGNMLFRGDKVAAVTDYDNARIMQRVLDVANGALQFSRINGAGSPRTWAAELDMDRLRKFLAGYDATPGCVLSKVELDVMPWLMIEALIAESAIPIGRSGLFGRYRGAEFLHTAERRARWMESNADKISSVLD
jgi:homoserine kinase type II